MKHQLLRDPITHEPIGVLLTTSPDLWDECYAPESYAPDQRCSPEHDTTWAELFGLDES